MSNKRIYRRVSVNQIEMEVLKERAIELGGCGTSVGLCCQGRTCGRRPLG